MPGLILAAPTSGAGKTTLTLGLLRALKNAGHAIRSAKSGPDYIDPQFHAAATSQPCVNLDAWAMAPDHIKSLASCTSDLIIEGAMGLFDGAPDGSGSTAALAKILNLPVVLIVDAKAMSHSIAALVAGFANHDPDVNIAGVILNRVGSARHSAILTCALAPLNIPVLGAVPRDAALSRPSRHLGLVQAGEMPDLDAFLNTAAGIMSRCIDLNALRALMAALPAPTDRKPHPNRSARIAVARDAAFSFTYAHHLEWWSQSATIVPFSPLANDPVPEADRIFLPGGYPELYAARLAQNSTFMNSLKDAAQSTEIYGECGGYMTLGETLIDADGTSHKMAGLLGLTTSFATRKLHLGYRSLRAIGPFHPDVYSVAGTHTGHEFHYATTINAQGAPLFDAADADGTPLGPIGLMEGRVAGSFAHIIGRDTSKFVAKTQPSA
ncbi:cobyrinate a,c-diamide synthase [Octadecabacter sp.]|nr:cobyrinate a,c-diamide synthase [Octadecabacter sp.]